MSRFLLLPPPGFPFDFSILRTDVPTQRSPVRVRPSAPVHVRPAFSLWHVGVGRGAVVGRRPPAPAAATARFLCAGERIKDIVKVVPLRVLERGRKEGRKEGRKAERADTRSLSQILQRRVEL